MTILQAIENANSEADIRNFQFANIQEFNSFLDSFEFIDYPCHVITPFATNLSIGGDVQGGLIRTVVPLSGWILKRIPQDTTNFRSIQVQKDHIEPMRVTAKRFLKYLTMPSDSEFDIIDSDAGTITATITPEYQFLPVNLFGVSYIIQLPVIESVC